MFENWEQRHEKAKQMTQLMRLRAKVRQLERIDYETYLEKISVINDSIIPQCNHEFTLISKFDEKSSTKSNQGPTTPISDFHNEFYALKTSFEESIIIVNKFQSVYKLELEQQRTVS